MQMITHFFPPKSGEYGADLILNNLYIPFFFVFNKERKKYTINLRHKGLHGVVHPDNSVYSISMHVPISCKEGKFDILKLA